MSYFFERSSYSCIKDGVITGTFIFMYKTEALTDIENKLMTTKE